jgi:hypothetical protein
MLGLLATPLQICATLFPSGPLIFLWNFNTIMSLLMFALAATVVSAIAMSSSVFEHMSRQVSFKFI